MEDLAACVTNNTHPSCASFSPRAKIFDCAETTFAFSVQLSSLQFLHLQSSSAYIISTRI